MKSCQDLPRHLHDFPPLRSVYEFRWLMRIRTLEEQPKSLSKIYQDIMLVICDPKIFPVLYNRIAFSTEGTNSIIKAIPFRPYPLYPNPFLIFLVSNTR